MKEDLTEVVARDLGDAASALEALRNRPEMLAAIASAGRLLAESMDKGGKVMSCGNGGSLCDAMHFAEEMTGRYRNDRRPYAAVSMGDASHMSCVGNDYGYEQVFARYVEGLGRPGDVLLAISTSGTSRNILLAAQAARAKGMKVIGLTGRENSPLAQASDIAIVTPAGKYADRVQELHIKVIHILIEITERLRDPQNYPDAE